MRKAVVAVSLLALALLFCGKEKAPHSKTLALVEAEPSESEVFDSATARHIQERAGMGYQTQDLQADHRSHAGRARPPSGTKVESRQPSMSSSRDLSRYRVLSKPKALQASQPLVKPQAHVTAQPGASAGQPILDPADRELLKKLSNRARTQGSQVVYIGKIPELYAFDPRFFGATTDAEGKKTLVARRVESREKVDTPEGPREITVERLPYPVPSESSINYELLSRAIFKATDEGAMLINLTSADVDRARLDSAIAYARNRGVVVVTVSPAEARR